MATLSQLYLYPIKSCAGIALHKATATASGLMSGRVHDRQWMVVDQHGDFITQREYPFMACIVPQLQSDAMRLQAPGMDSLDIPLDSPSSDATVMQVRVWDDTLLAQDCGEGAAAWFSRAIGINCRLVRFHPQVERAIQNQWTTGREVRTQFADGFPMLVISEASLDDVNQKLRAQQRDALPMNRFRPNLVINGVDAFEEDYAQTIDIGPVRLQPVKPCPRCSIPAVDQTTGISGPDPLDIMQAYRANPLVDGGITFGMNAILIDGENQVLEVGQEVNIELAF